MLKYKTLAKAVIEPGIYVLDSIIFDGGFSLTISELRKIQNSGGKIHFKKLYINRN